MKDIMLIAGAFVLVTMLFLHIRRRNRVAIANTINACRYLNGVKTLTADAAIARHQVVKTGAAETSVALGTTAAKPIGIVRGAWDSGDAAAVHLFGAAQGTEIGIADAAIAVDVRLTPGTTSGRLRTMPAGAGTYWICGNALTAAAAAGDEFEFVPCTPYAVIVP